MCTCHVDQVAGLQLWTLHALRACVRAEYESVLRTPRRWWCRTRLTRRASSQQATQKPHRSSVFARDLVLSLWFWKHTVADGERQPARRSI